MVIEPVHCGFSSILKVCFFGTPLFDYTYHISYLLPKSEDNLKLVVSDVILEGDVNILDPVYLQEVFQLAHSFLL